MISPHGQRAARPASTIASRQTLWWASRSPAPAPTGACRRGSVAARAMPSRLASTARRNTARLAAAFAFANHWMSTDRLAVSDHLTADFNAQSYGGRLEGGYRFATPYAGITPYAAIQAQNFHTPGYTEAGLIPMALRSVSMAATPPTQGASWARASTGFWRSIPMRYWRCAAGSPGRMTG